VPGLLLGATYGTLRTQTPILVSLYSSTLCFGIGSTYWGIRSAILDQVGLENWWRLTRGQPLLPRTDLGPSPSQRVFASTISGGSTGCILALLVRGPRNAIPATIMFSLYGYGGQLAYNWLDAKNSKVVKTAQSMKEKGQEEVPFLQKIAKSKWSPMSVLNDDEYERLMGEKLLRVEAEIALIDDKIEGLRKKQEELNAQKKKA